MLRTILGAMEIATNKTENNSCPQWTLYSPCRRRTKQIVCQMVISAMEINKKRAG